MALVAGEEKGFAHMAQESIATWGEAAGIADLSPDICSLLASDVTYRLRQVLYNATHHLHACKRQRLSTDDFNRVLQMMDVPPVYGHSNSAEGADWINLPEVGVHIVADPPLNLASTALPGEIYHQPGNPCVKGEWVYISNHVTIKGEAGNEGSLSPLQLSAQLTKYYSTLISAIFGHSDTIFQMLLRDLETNSRMSPLVGAIISGCLRGAQLARQNPCILRRVLLVVRALLSNAHLHVGHAKYVRDIISLIVFCVVTERKHSYDTHPIRSLATNTMLKVLAQWSEGCAAWDVAVSSLGAVIASTSRPWSQHTGALNALLALGPAAQLSLLHCYASYHSRLRAALPLTNATGPSTAIVSRESIDAKQAQGLLMAVLVKIVASYVREMPERLDLTVPRKCKNADSSEISESSASEGAPDVNNRSQGDDNGGSEGSDQQVSFSKLRQVYALGESWFGSAFVLQLPSVYLCVHESQMPSFMESHVYQELRTTGEALLKDALSREENIKNKISRRNLGGPFQKKRKTNDGNSVGTSFDLQSDSFAGLDFTSLMEEDGSSLGAKFSPDEAFVSYRRIQPRYEVSVHVNIQGCRVWDKCVLKRPKKSALSAADRPQSTMFRNYAFKSSVQKMPHCQFTRPLLPKLKPGYSLHNLIL
ncbi:TAF6-like RNA polymerase II p300/CBP-associated factor-associated factor 65 kDa subunit 6L [Hyalella azteca]|uniref:TAF6-like RNA polymerase II p300/CBP-associated factor-associated factor 65 kDa subunit 6L n=1 Tax=Hyalella azteca TaxID=294128 RepID=A0A8B7NKP7_HYAAZ|nr:TAF6-like RNA polymerase II p300/CBP-associated factor-associated factor 65 kDa subunit 6L [Hyalella azteca]